MTTKQFILGAGIQLNVLVFGLFPGFLGLAPAPATPLVAVLLNTVVGLAVKPVNDNWSQSVNDEVLHELSTYLNVPACIEIMKQSIKQLAILNLYACQQNTNITVEKYYNVADHSFYNAIRSVTRILRFVNHKLAYLLANDIHYQYHYTYVYSIIKYFIPVIY